MLFKYKKIPYIEFVPIIIITFLLYKIVVNLENIYSMFLNFFSLLSYFIWGFIIAYLLNPLMVYIEKEIKLKRIYSISIIYTLFIGIILLIVILVTPNVIKSAVDLFNNIPHFANSAYNWSTNYLNQSELMNKYNISSYFENYLKTFNKDISTYFTPGLQIIIDNLMGISSMFIKLMSGIVISIYLLFDKEAIIHNLKKFIYCIINEKASINVIHFLGIVNTTFKKYFVGKMIDSIIFGIITFIGFIILKIPYALPFSLVIGVTNMIPYFGNIIGMIPAVIITIFFNPIKSVEIVLFITTLSNIDGWFISPKIIGDKVGISPLLIILGIVLGGGLFGIVGMLLGVPVIALIKNLLEDFMDKSIKNKQID
ncbi:AI-2E family transporter [Clostridium lacusfryxellense]|uniref:AI-2E family transporter n=1 Tax=Clostridium lacusfryxellense TaxID=205328 RepID=UPI001C0DA9DC|nr:AI-2E family transporter [Clostridium lacusfryxellense]MBU3112159.1 AI-2E family transporter [Clostridium lacusfryxellense]